VASSVASLSSSVTAQAAHPASVSGRKVGHLMVVVRPELPGVARCIPPVARQLARLRDRGRPWVAGPDSRRGLDLADPARVRAEHRA
jgi:hypothetical protein